MKLEMQKQSGNVLETLLPRVFVQVRNCNLNLKLCVKHCAPRKRATIRGNSDKKAITGFRVAFEPH